MSKIFKKIRCFKKKKKKKKKKKEEKNLKKKKNCQDQGRVTTVLIPGEMADRKLKTLMLHLHSLEDLKIVDEFVR